MGMKDAADAVFERFGVPVVFRREGEETPLPCLLKEAGDSAGEAGYFHTVIGVEEGAGEGEKAYLCAGPYGKLDPAGEYRARWRERDYLVSGLAGRGIVEDGLLYFSCLLSPDWEGLPAVVEPGGRGKDLRR